METQWGEMEEIRSSERTADLPPSAGTEPSSLPGSFRILLWDRASAGGPCPKGTRGCHPARSGAASGSVVRGRSVLLAQPQQAAAGEDGLLAGTRDSPGQGSTGWVSSLAGQMVVAVSQHIGGILVASRLLVVPCPGHPSCKGPEQGPGGGAGLEAISSPLRNRLGEHRQDQGDHRLPHGCHHPAGSAPGVW